MPLKVELSNAQVNASENISKRNESNHVNKFCEVALRIYKNIRLA